MIFVRGDNVDIIDDAKKKKLYNLHRQSTKNNTTKYTEIFEIFCEMLTNIYVLMDKDIIVGYVLIELKNTTLNIIWLYGPGYGKIIITNIEKKFKKNITIIRLLCPLSVKNKKASMIRLKFFLKRKYVIEDFNSDKNCDYYIKMSKRL